MSTEETTTDSNFESTENEQTTLDDICERVAAFESRLATVEDEMFGDAQADQPEPGVPQDDGTVVCPACGHRGKVLRSDGGCWECGVPINLQWRDNNE